ncbi:MAG: hypothetical protein DMG76_10395 [Acidobacteria bacterium]|nr:MAG: hypothetical protein DMG76_10395 [Acidobacteriota bacterium]
MLRLRLYKIQRSSRRAAATVFSRTYERMREGARALGLDARADALYMADLPRKFHALKPHEIEDVLCIFKDELASSRQTLPRASRRSWCV